MPQAARWVGSPSIKGKTESMRMALLTFSLLGLQFTWGIEMTYCTPYLLQLGLTKSRTSLVWIAGPLSGLIIQPLIGVIADRSRSKWGRRRPFMLFGSIVVTGCLLVLGWTSEIVGLFVEDAEKANNATIALAVLSIYAVDFAINIVQACCRSLIVDTLPISSQQSGSAWATRMSAIGQLIGYVIGSIDTVSIFGTTIGDTQFKQMTVIAALSLLIAVAVTSYCVKERVLVTARDSDEKTGTLQVISQLIKTTMDLPPRIQAICWAQFWAWIGWFPFLFYSTTWVGETYFRFEVPKDSIQPSDMLGEVGRVGSLSLVVFSSITFIGSVLLPFCVQPPDSKRPRFTPRPPPGIAALLKRIMAYRPDLQLTWLISHIMFAATMIFAPLARSRAFATFLVALCGIPWAITCWAPFAFMGVEINKLALGPNHRPTSSGVTMITSSSLRAAGAYGDANAADSELDVLRLNHDHDDTDSEDSDVEGGSSSNIPSTGELAGIYLGVLNVYTTLPQFVGTFISWIVFSILEPGSTKPDDSTPNNDAQWMNLDKDSPNAISICLFIGSLSSLIAVEATRRLRYTL
ncbi:putative sucrose transporter [Aspergillus candidus]|uniref:Sucrose transport protein n=1 Tax=Aspergillus candidus TaxID=41067 RepID=A0A2I2FCN8_ASPCN|nr:sucrose transport protein [Aspergillus candidus]PLB38384.1 sucrose transport protein [Aspergillus candidus]